MRFQAIFNRKRDVEASGLMEKGPAPELQLVLDAPVRHARVVLHVERHQLGIRHVNRPLVPLDHLQMHRSEPHSPYVPVVSSLLEPLSADHSGLGLGIEAPDVLHPSVDVFTRQGDPVAYSATRENISKASTRLVRRAALNAAPPR